MTLLSAAQRELLETARTATLATLAPDGRPRLVPICYAIAPPTPRRADEREPPLRLWTPLDEKPKRDADPRRLARVRDILVLPEVTLLVDCWDEDWSRLAWLRLSGSAELLEPQEHERSEHAEAVAALRARYPQYADQALEGRPVIRIRVDRATGWDASAA